MKYTFIEILRCMAICMVVLLHTVTGGLNILDLSGHPETKNSLLLMMDLITWCVPVFLIISGYLFLDPDRHMTFFDSVRKYCRRIILALFLFGVPYAFIELVAVNMTFNWKMPGRAFLMVLRGESWSHLWYLYLILALYLITPALKRILAMLPLWCICLIMGLLLLFCSLCPYLNKRLGIDSIPVMPIQGIYLFYYLSGYLFKIKDNKVSGTRSCKMPVIILAVIIGILIADRLLLDNPLQMAYNYPPTAAIALLLFRAVQSGEIKWKEKNRKTIRHLSDMSFCIYLIHPVFLNLIYKVLHYDLYSMPLFPSILLLFGITFTLSCFNACILRKIPLMRRYVC